MAKRSYMPAGEQDRRALLTELIKKLEPVAPLLGLSPEDMLTLKSDVTTYSYTVEAKLRLRAKAKEWTEHAFILERGTGPNPAPAPLILDPPPPGVEPGVFPRLAKLISHIKTHRNYTVALGKDLGIEGPESSMNVNDLKPDLDLRMYNGRPVLRWNKKGSHSLEIHADRGTGAFTPIATSTTARYTDTAALPAPGTGVIWKYKAIYRMKDSTVGKWSDDVSVGVFG